jgi:hypothetical protein
MDINDDQIIIIRDYVHQLENNIEHLKEQILILLTQKDLCNSKNKQLLLQIAQLQIMLSNPDRLAN